MAKSRFDEISSCRIRERITILLKRKNGYFQVHYASQHDLDAMQQGGNAIVSEEIQIASDGSTVVVPRSEGGTIAYASEPTTIKTDGGSIQIVQIRLAEDSDEQKQWIDLLQAQQQN